MALHTAASRTLLGSGTASASKTYPCRVVDDELLTVKQIAKELGLANTKVMSLVRRGAISTVARPAGPATWRISREALDAYLDEQHASATQAAARRRNRQLRDLIDAWNNLADSDMARIEADVATDMLGPLKRLTDPECTDPAGEIEALSHAYRRRTEAGVEELALDLPHDLFWAVARIS